MSERSETIDRLWSDLCYEMTINAYDAALSILEISTSLDEAKRRLKDLRDAEALNHLARMDGDDMLAVREVDVLPYPETDD